MSFFKSNSRCFAASFDNGDIECVWDFEKIEYVRFVDSHTLDIRSNSGLNQKLNFANADIAKEFIESFYKYLCN